MNWFIIAVGVALVAALTAAFVGPMFVDWTQYRDTIEASAERVLGTSIAIDGEADLRLLPRPRLHLTDVRFGPADRPVLEAEAVEIDVELTPLLKREVEIAGLRLERPTVYLRIDADGRVELPDLDAASGLASVRADSVAIDSLTLEDATLVILDERTGLRRTVDDIRLAGSARSLRGPFNVAGTATLGGLTQNVSINAGALEGGAIPLTARVVPADSGIALTFEGALSPQRSAPALAGTFAVDSTSDTPWSVRGDVALDPAALRLSRATLSYGEGDTPLQLAGRATYDLSGTEPIELAFEARQIDLDRVDRALRAGRGSDAGGSPATPAIPAPVEMVSRFAAHLAPMIDGIGRLPRLGVPVEGRIDVDTLLVGGAVVRDVSARLGTGTEGLDVDHVEALLPGDTSVESSGTLTADGYSGAVRISASQPSILARWWTGARSVSAVVDPLRIEADIEASSKGFDAQRLSVRLGDSSATGRMRYRIAGGGSNVAVAMRASMLDLGDVADVASLVPRTAIPREGTDVTLDLAVDRIRVGTVEGSSLNVDGSYRDGTLTLDALAAEDLAGMQMFASGVIGDLTGDPLGSIEGTLLLKDGAALSASLRELFPLSTTARRVAALAPALAPADVRVQVAGGTTAARPELSLTLDGRANATELHLSAAGAPLDAQWTSKPMSVSFTADNPDGAVLARQFGLASAPAGHRGSFTLEATGTPQDGASTRLTIDGLGATLRYDGTVTYDGAVGLAGRVEADARTLEPLATLFALPLPSASTVSLAADVASFGGDLSIDGLSGTIAGAAVSGDLTIARSGLKGALATDSVDLVGLSTLVLGAPAWSAPQDGQGWPNAAFQRRGLPAWPVHLAIRADEMTIGSRRMADARFDLALAAAGLTLSHGSASAGDGTIEGSLSVVRSGAEAAVSGRFALAGGDLGALAWRAEGEPVAAGTLDVAAEFATSGYTVAGLMTGLTGTGTLALTDGRFRGINPEPFDLAEGDVDTAPPDEADARQAFLEHLAAAHLPFDRLTADIAIRDGTMRLRDVAIAPAVPVTVEAAAIDLASWQVRGDLAMRTAASEAEAVPLAVDFAGPLDAPRRSVDVASLTAWMARRQLARQMEAVERDNEALAAEADAVGAPSSDALRSLGLDAGAAPDASPRLQTPEADAGRDARSRGLRPEALGTNEGTGPRSDVPVGDDDIAGRLASVTQAHIPLRSVRSKRRDSAPQSDAGATPDRPDESGRAESAPSGGPSRAQPVSDDDERRDEASGDAVGTFLRQVDSLDGELTAYEAKRAERSRIAEELIRGLGLSPPASSRSAPPGRLAEGPTDDMAATAGVGGAGIGQDGAGSIATGLRARGAAVPLPPERPAPLPFRVRQLDPAP